MALSAYLQRTEALLQNPSAPSSLYDPALLTGYVNEARFQLAGDSTSIKRIGSFALTPASQGPYLYSSITLTNATGVQGVLDVRTLWYIVGDGQIWVRGRPWPWFSFYQLGNVAPEVGAPKTWAQYGEGVAGSAYFWPTPDVSYTMSADCVCYPIDLVDDTTVEAIPKPWTFAVPYYAAYLALLSAQTGARIQDAQRMFELYGMFVQRSRAQVTPDILSTMFPQQQSPVSPIPTQGGPAA